MQSSELRELAAAREARHGKPAPATSRPSARSSSLPFGVPLQRAHRSIRLARSLGLLIAALSALPLLSRSWSWAAGLLLCGVGFARSGGSWLHGVLSPMLRESPPPPAQPPPVCDGLLAHPTAVLDGEAWRTEWAASLENLAFVCTYGKKNCLTGDMYRGELSLGKICSLVGAKLREGVVRC